MTPEERALNEEIKAKFKTVKDVLEYLRPKILESKSQNELLSKIGCPFMVRVQNNIEFNITDYFLIEEVYKVPNKIKWFRFYIDVFCPDENTWHKKNAWSKSMEGFIGSYPDILLESREARKRYLINLLYPRIWFCPIRSAFRKLHLIL